MHTTFLAGFSLANLHLDRFAAAFLVLQMIVAGLLMLGILLQTPKATGLGGTIGGGDPGSGGGYRTRRGLERTIFQVTIGLVVLFVLVSAFNLKVLT
ncbi:MAG: preprotein translocase subunit SecG [Candidatus Dormibacteria bacterium]